MKLWVTSILQVKIPGQYVGMADTHQLRSPCPLAALLDVLGDRWTLLVVRDLLFFNKHTFGELEAGPEHISTNTLADRLRRLEEHGIITRAAYQQRPTRYRYELTAKGQALEPLLREAIRWGSRHVAGTADLPPNF